MLHKMALDSMNNGEVAAVHHPIAKKKYCGTLSCLVTSELPVSDPK